VKRLVLVPVLLFAQDFQTAIAPILKANCAACHSAKTKTSGFSIDTLESVVGGGNKHGRAVVAGHPEQSPLVRVLRGEIQPRMPMGGELGSAEVAAIESWIRAMTPSNAPTFASGWNPFQQPVKAGLPKVKHTAWVRNPIDGFILEKLEGAEMQPAPAAGKRTLARRVYLDLVGLPPSVAEMNEFLGDSSADAYEKLVDKLLDDPRYGERWGRHWLDLARYGETSGLEGDGQIGNVWRYRDWVVEAFNKNMPYDRFVLLQIAGGDEHSKTRNNYPTDVQGYIPTAFLRLAPWDRSNLVAAEVRQNYLSEVTSTVGSVFLGLTVGCARCHDHKYDPIPQKDFYRLQAFFNATQAGPPVAVPYKDEAMAEYAAQQVKKYDERIKSGPEKTELDELEKQLLKKLVAGRVARAEGKPYKVEDLRLEIKLKPRRVFTESEVRQHAQLLEDATRTGDLEEKTALDAFEGVLLDKLKSAYSNGLDPVKRFDALGTAEVRAEATAQYSGRSIFSEEEKNRYAELSGKLDILRRKMDRWGTNVVAVTNVAGPPSGPYIAPTRILTRGDYNHPGEAVEAGFPSAITGNFDNAVLETDRYRQFPTRGHRMTLAKWIASRDNPLTARVMVNRIWRYHFGEGIVRTTSDFGRNGERPSHPELLDWLAVRFMESGWDIKAMHKLILLSSTYQQAAENPALKDNSKDPDNHLLSHFSRRRLEAEVIRDSILFASGRLNGKMGGPSVFPPLPADLADFARYGRTGGLMWEPNDADEDARRRSIYIFQRRSLPLPMMAAFDAPVFSESCERRSSTTTPLQALSLMNGSLVQEESAHLARRVLEEAGPSREAQIARAFEIVLGRPPSPIEARKFAADGGTLESIGRVLLSSNEFVYME
jgi:hypothetical protein